MGTHTMRNAKAASSDPERPRRRALRVAVLLLVLGTVHAEAYRGVVLGAGGFVALAVPAEAAEKRRVPTAAEIMAYIDKVAVRHRVPPGLVAAIVGVESEFNPRALSPRGAQGLMQLMPATAADLGLVDSFDMRENLDGGVRHLRGLMLRYNNDLPLVLAAYNAGDRAVIAYRGVPPFPQTQRYVIKVLRRYDHEAARAAATRIYGSDITPTLAARPSRATWLVSREAPSPAASTSARPAPPSALVSIESTTPTVRLTMIGSSPDGQAPSVRVTTDLALIGVIERPAFATGRGSESP
jgi:soluble lytic murein transglycosylase-like protein